MPDTKPWSFHSHLFTLCSQSQSASWCQSISAPCLRLSRPLTRGTFICWHSEMSHRIWSTAAACSSLVISLYCFMPLLSKYLVWLLCCHSEYVIPMTKAVIRIAHYVEKVAIKGGTKQLCRLNLTLTTQCRFLLPDVGLPGSCQGETQAQLGDQCADPPPPPRAFLTPSWLLMTTKTSEIICKQTTLSAYFTSVLLVLVESRSITYAVDYRKQGSVI